MLLSLYTQHKNERGNDLPTAHHKQYYQASGLSCLATANSVHASLLVGLTCYLVAQNGQFPATNVIISEHGFGGTSDIYIEVFCRSNFKHTGNSEMQKKK